MMGWFGIVFIFQFLACLFSTVQPIKVTFGTNEGSITPLYPTPTLQPKQLPQFHDPAPVYETIIDDTPNPYIYRAPVPLQYRNGLFSAVPKPNAINPGATPIDKKYQYEQKVDYNAGLYYKGLRNPGPTYTGPQFFEKQPYEKYLARSNFFRVVPKFYDGEGRVFRGKYVPEIGVVYSGGVKYYVPQVGYSEEERENSVYDDDGDY